MESVIASAIAVLGTLLGSVATLAIQRGTAERGHRFTRDEKLRQERLDAYVTYAGALVDYRRCLIHLWFCLHESPPPENPDEVRIRSYDLRTRAQESLFRVQMLTADEALGRAGSRLLDEVSELHKAEGRVELDVGRERTREGIAGLVREAKGAL
ncbi:hypothetical protein [Streptomyces albidoflavus]|uniref:hypothetical protein n=1 Tax=Streptomyces albidoflavus TaxID=1886 RepID=UPI00102057F7|nr:hypothetical protein [Streptomyces albidoflavus]RZD80493.1 hypothetical protein C0Q61_11025 [Streptomyces albidoflavus]